MINAAEYVSLGHPDSTADAIASYLLDRYLEEDPKARFALEVQLKDHTVNLAGDNGAYANYVYNNTFDVNAFYNCVSLQSAELPDSV